MRRAVRDEIAKKAKLGQYVVINRDGKPCRILAADALLEMREEDSAYGPGPDVPPPGPGGPTAQSRRRDLEAGRTTAPEPLPEPGEGDTGRRQDRTEG